MAVATSFIIYSASSMYRLSAAVLLNPFVSGASVGESLHSCNMCRTPDMSAMHHDSSPDLRVVGSKLKDILEVIYS